MKSEINTIEVTKTETIYQTFLNRNHQLLTAVKPYRSLELKRFIGHQINL